MRIQYEKSKLNIWLTCQYSVKIFYMYDVLNVKNNAKLVVRTQYFIFDIISMTLINSYNGRDL